MSEGAIMVIIGSALMLFGIIGTAATVVDMLSLKRMAAAMENQATVAELQLLHAEVEAEQYEESALAEVDGCDENKKPLLVRKGAERIASRRAEAGL